MPRRNVRRFVLEVLFLAGVAAALTVADLRPAAVVGLMVAAWLVVALIEWSAWLGEPHYGRGLPPRYYVPQVALPPPRAVEQYRGGYPVLGVHDDEPTFVASTTEWAAELADWPLEAPVDALEETQVSAPEDRVVPLPPPIHELETVAADFFLPEVEEDVPPGVEPEREPEPQVDEPAPVAAIAETVIAGAIVEAAVPPAVEAVPMPAPNVVPQAAPDAVPVLSLPPRAASTVTHRVDPLAGTGRSRFWRRRVAEVDTVEVRDGPPPDRVLPSRVRAGV
ncbi:MAG TPA: hypothetical protein VH063_10330 [Gaiellaceae bacterium]|jgi:hypothetical protein|nr:hypothetical protein [Gaiellaceae bacterium]